PPKFLVNLIDSSQIVAPLMTTEIKLRSLGRDMTIPVERLAGIEMKSEKGAFSILLKNDDNIDAELKTEEFKFSTALGELSIPLTKIQSVSRSYGNITAAKPAPS